MNTESNIENVTAGDTAATEFSEPVAGDQNSPSEPPTSVNERQVPSEVVLRQMKGAMLYYKEADTVWPAIVVNANADGTLDLVVFTSDGVEAPKRNVAQGTEVGQWDWPR